MTITTRANGGFAIKPNGSLWSWGDNRGGVVGDGTATKYGWHHYIETRLIKPFPHKVVRVMEDNDRHSPVEVMSDVIAISSSANGGFAMAIKNDKSLWAWGNNWGGVLGDGTSTKIASGDSQFLIIEKDNNRHSPIKILDDVISVSTGAGNTMAIKTDGSLWLWGGNFYGQLGNGEFVPKTPEELASMKMPKPEKLMDDVIAVSAESHSAAVKADGSLWLWGSNFIGQIGDNTTTDRHIPVKIMDDVIAVSSGMFYTTAIKADNTLWAWGGNQYGQLGDGTKRGRKAPVKIMDDVIQVSAGESHTMAIKKDGSLWAWGVNSNGQLGATKIPKQSIPTKIMDDAAYVSAGSGHTMAIKKDGSLWAWGCNKYGQLGNGKTKGSRTPIRIMDEVMMPF